MDFIISALKNNKAAVGLAILVGLIGIAPHIWFRISLGSEYRGLYMTQAANELEYLSRVQEISEGHWKLGSVPFLEYKSHPPFMPPSVLEIFSALASKLFFVSISTVFIVSKAVLPAILFLLIYALVLRLGGNTPAAKWWGLAAAAFSLLGYDLIDYRSVLGFLRGGRGPDEFLIWTRPMNPILGGILVFLFLQTIGKLYERVVIKVWSGRIVGGVILGLGILSYFFSWGTMLAFLGVVFLVALFQKRWDMIRNSFWIVVIAILVASPYWYNLWKVSKNPTYMRDYLDSVMRSGLFLTHTPIINKVTLATLLVFLGLTWWDDRKRALIHFRQRELWWYVAFSMIMVGLVVFNQQIVTGKTIWPYHFVQYVILLCVSALAILAAHLEWLPRRLHQIGVGFIIGISLIFGVYAQTTTYAQNVELYRGRQHYADLIYWLNKKAIPECVVLTEDRFYLTHAIPAFTRCNVYVSDYWSFLLPSERIYHNYLVALRLQGISETTIDAYLKDAYPNTLVYFLGTEVMGKLIQYEDYHVFLERIASDYKNFLQKDFLSEIKRYRIDYLMVEKGKTMAQELIRNRKPIYSAPQWELYEL